MSKYPPINFTPYWVVEGQSDRLDFREFSNLIDYPGLEQSDTNLALPTWWLISQSDFLAGPKGGLKAG